MSETSAQKPERWVPPPPREATTTSDGFDGPHGENPELIDEGDER